MCFWAPENLTKEESLKWIRLIWVRRMFYITICAVCTTMLLLATPHDVYRVVPKIIKHITANDTQIPPSAIAIGCSILSALNLASWIAGPCMLLFSIIVGFYTCILCFSSRMQRHHSLWLAPPTTSDV